MPDARSQLLCTKQDIKERRQMKKISHESLTQRELEVLCLMADGYTQKEIAQRLFVSASTINTHAQHIYDKIGARSSANAVFKMHNLIVSFRG